MEKESSKESDGKKHPNKSKAKQAKLRKQYKKAAGISAAELERRLKQRESARNKQYASVSSPQLRPILMAESIRLRGTEGVLRALIDPDNSPPIRLPGGGQPTFVVKLKAVVPASIVPSTAQTPNAAGELTPNSGFAVKRRDPRCSLIVFQYNVSGASVYALVAKDGGDNCPLNNQGYMIVGISQYISGYQRHGKYNLPWIFADEQTRLWMQSEAATPTLISVTGLAATTACTLDVGVLLNGVQGTRSFNATTDASGNAVFTCSASFAGYCAYRVGQGGAYKSVPLSINDKSTGMVRHLAAPQFWENLADVDAVRSNACSLMYSDRTASAYSQGDVCSYQSPGGDPWEKHVGAADGSSFLNCDPYGQVPTYQDGYKGPYKHGKYIPLKFVDDPREQQMFNIEDSNEPWEVPPIDYRIQMPYLYIGFNFGTANAGAPLPVGEWTAVEGDEGLTESQWKETKVPGTHPDVLKEAKWCFSQVKADFENISHLVKIWNWVKKNAPHVLESIGQAVGGAGPYGAAASAGLGGAAQVLRMLQ